MPGWVLIFCGVGVAVVIFIVYACHRMSGIISKMEEEDMEKINHAK